MNSSSESSHVPVVNDARQMSLGSALDKIRICVEHLSRKTPLQRFLQRQEISESIKEGHHCLDGCLELFHVCSSLPCCRVLVHGSDIVYPVTSDICCHFRFR